MPLGNEFHLWRDAFQCALQEPEHAIPLKAASLANDLKSWTASLTAAIVSACQGRGWLAAAKGHRLAELPEAKNEFLGIDVMAFPGTASTGRWKIPIAVFELENSKSDDRVAYSLWKVLCVRSQLRVVCAFRQDWESSVRTVDAVCRDVIGSLTAHERMTFTGETILIVGNRGEGETFPWGYFKTWQLDANVGRFEKI